MREARCPDTRMEGDWMVPTVFLAGSIEQGRATEWQREVLRALWDVAATAYNPRREHWDPHLRMSPDEPVFRGQVEWELERIQASDVAFFYFDPGTNSPISLLELGLVLGAAQHVTKDVVVCCPRSYARYGNVRITMERYHKGSCLHEELPAAIEALRAAIKDVQRRHGIPE